jgi:hypothetical protein
MMQTGGPPGGEWSHLTVGHQWPRSGELIFELAGRLRCIFVGQPKFGTRAKGNEAELVAKSLNGLSGVITGAEGRFHLRVCLAV